LVVLRVLVDVTPRLHVAVAVAVVVTVAAWPPSARATTLGDAVRVSFSDDADFGYNATAPALARDPVSGRVLAVWSVGPKPYGDDLLVVARLLSSGGRPIGPQMLLGGLSPAASSTAAFVLPGGRGFVVAASVERFASPRATAVRAVRITTAGVVGRTRTVSPPVRFSDGGIYGVAAASDRDRGSGLIAWAVSAFGAGARVGGIFARAVDGHGRPRGAAVALGSTRSPQLRLVHAVTDGALVVWAGDGLGLMARSLSAAGQPRGRALRLRTSGSVTTGFGTLGAGGGGDPPLVPFAVSTRTGSEIRLQRVGASARRTPPLLVIARRGRRTLVQAPVIGDVPRAGLRLVTWSKTCNLFREQCLHLPVQARWLTSGGRPAGPPLTIADDSLGAPAVTQTSHNRLLVAWPGVAATGRPSYSDAGMYTLVPQKAEIIVRTISP
jgi:hypothetical protein